MSEFASSSSASHQNQNQTQSATPTPAPEVQQGSSSQQQQQGGSGQQQQQGGGGGGPSSSSQAQAQAQAVLAPHGGEPVEGVEEITDHTPVTDAEIGEYREQDRFLPIANVARIMKSSVPPTAKIAKDAKECVQECVSEFISFITSEAAEKCQLEKRKTIGGEDILYAMISLGFENYAEALKIYLAKLRQHQTTSTDRTNEHMDFDEE